MDYPSFKLERNSKRRPIIPPEALLNIEDLGESSDDSDFRIEDHCLDESDSSGSSGSSSASEDESESDSDDSDIKPVSKPSNDTKEQLSQKLISANSKINDDVIKKILICCVCLGDNSDDTNEIIECDGCGITVHEGCYGVQDTASIASTISSCSTEPWFCEACRAGVTNPTCELCPNFGGIFKETDVGKWVHLVCALYIPGIAFGDVDRLSNVTLFELPPNRWGNKPCQLCQDHRFVRTGITIECDAGMCRAFFHVTCGQREGLLSEASSDEVEQADPFFAHCKLHADKNQIKKLKRNWLALQLRTQKVDSHREKESIEESAVWKRNQRKLSKYKVKYCQMKTNRVLPWVPMQKRPRLLTTSASACRALWRKSELMGIDVESFEDTEALITTVQDIPKKWNIPPAFSVEFVGYFLDRDARVNRLKKQLSHHAENKSRLMTEQQELQQKYDNIIVENSKVVEQNTSLQNIVQMYHNIILKAKPTAKLRSVEDFGRINSVSENRHPLASAKGGVPTAAALKAGVGFPLRLQGTTIEEVKTTVGLNNKCGICSKSNDQHLLAKCDTCEKYYHLGCLNPPLTRMPKKTKLMGWQCSECDKNSSSSDNEQVDTDAPRKLRRTSKERGDSKNDSGNSARNSFDANENEALDIDVKKIKKRRREKHRDRYSPELQISSTAAGKHHRKRKHKSTEDASEQEPPRQGIKLFIKSVPNSSGQANFIATQSSTTSTFVAKTEEYVKTPSPTPPPVRVPRVYRKKHSVDMEMTCDTCKAIGTNANMVKCDECLKGFHFGCLDPPVKKSPKVRGYSWHCANCDPSDTDTD